MNTDTLSSVRMPRAWSCPALKMHRDRDALPENLPNLSAASQNLHKPGKFGYLIISIEFISARGRNIISGSRIWTTALPLALCDFFLINGLQLLGCKLPSSMGSACVQSSLMGAGGSAAYLEMVPLQEMQIYSETSMELSAQRVCIDRNWVLFEITE